jgi:hypothetical protein
LGVTGWDIIGDVHGCADKLSGLLNKLGYRKHDGAFRNSGRQAIFVGDLIDRGPDQVTTVDTVRAMVGAGSAQMIMGNHEFNAIAYATRDPNSSSDYMRRHSKKNVRGHKFFIGQIGDTKRRDLIEWFKTLPLWLELDGVRIVHACWHDQSMARLTAALDGHPMSEEFVVLSNTKGTPEFEAIEIVLKGPEFELGQDRAFKVNDHVRTGARIRWWRPDARTLHEVADIPPDAKTPEGLCYPPLGDEPCAAADEYRYESAKPVVFGHYWRTGIPHIDGPRTACVDYSAVGGGDLVAYRWDGEETLVDTNFVAFGGTDSPG